MSMYLSLQSGGKHKSVKYSTWDLSFWIALISELQIRTKPWSSEYLSTLNNFYKRQLTFQSQKYLGNGTFFKFLERRKRGKVGELPTYHLLSGIADALLWLQRPSLQVLLACVCSPPIQRESRLLLAKMWIRPTDTNPSNTKAVPGSVYFKIQILGSTLPVI